MSGVRRSVVRERMGSGGPRGLQILLSGADRVRGGFDSHTFPPLLCAALIGAACLAPAAVAADLPARVDADSVAAPADTTAARAAAPGAPADAAAAAPADTAAVRAPAPPRRTPAAPAPFSEPRWVMLRSAVLPGWGQAYNRQWLKAAAVAAVELGIAYRIYDDLKVLDDLDAQAAAATAAGDPALQNELALRYNDRLDTMVARQWLLAGVIVYALLDAYVDAHFRGFDVDFDTDPALPADAEAAPRLRAGLRWSF